MTLSSPKESPQLSGRKTNICGLARIKFSWIYKQTNKNHSKKKANISKSDFGLIRTLC